MCRLRIIKDELTCIICFILFILLFNIDKENK